MLNSKRAHGHGHPSTQPPAPHIQEKGCYPDPIYERRAAIRTRSTRGGLLSGPDLREEGRYPDPIYERRAAIRTRSTRGGLLSTTARLPCCPPRQSRGATRGRLRRPRGHTMAASLASAAT